jgi:hypothetical protein
MVFVEKRKYETPPHTARFRRTRAGCPRLYDKEGAKEICHSTKRTHFIFAQLAMYPVYLQKLIPFAEAISNGFVSRKRTHLEGFMEGLARVLMAKMTATGPVALQLEDEAGRQNIRTTMAHAAPKRALTGGAVLLESPCEVSPRLAGGQFRPWREKTLERIPCTWLLKN